MFNQIELDCIDLDYFDIILAGCFAVTVQSKTQSTTGISYMKLAVITLLAKLVTNTITKIPGTGNATDLILPHHSMR